MASSTLRRALIPAHGTRRGRCSRNVTERAVPAPLQNLRVLRAKHRAQGLASHVHGTSACRHTAQRAFVKQPAVAGVELPPPRPRPRPWRDSVRNSTVRSTVCARGCSTSGTPAPAATQLGNGGRSRSAAAAPGCLERHRSARDQLAPRGRRRVLVGAPASLMCRLTDSLLLLYRRADTARRWPDRGS